MSKRWLKIILPLVSIVVFSDNLFCGECSIRYGDYQGVKSVILENDLIGVIVLPDFNGLIAEYNFKPQNKKMFLPVAIKKFDVSDKVTLVDTNFGGYKDWFWETGLVRASLRYKCRVLSDSGDASKICLEHTKSDVKIKRYISIFSNSTVLKIDIQLTGIAKDAFKRSYWAHNYLNELEAGDKFLIPLAKVNVEKKKGCKVFNFDKTDHPDIYDIRVITNDVPGSYFFVPAQSWWGIIKKEGTCFIQEILGIEKVNSSDGLFYASCTKGRATQEVIYQTEEFKQNTEKRYQINYLACNGFKDLDYASSNIFICIEEFKKKDGGINCRINISSPQYIKDSRLDLYLHNGSQEIVKSISLEELSPKRIEARIVNIDQFDLNDKLTKVKFKFYKEEKLVESGEIVKEVRVQKW